MDVKECFENRLLRKVPIDKEKIKNSLKISNNKLFRAKELLSKDFFEEALLSSYTSIFHAARALLYAEGVQEKSHYAVYVYLKEKYKKKIPNNLIEAFRNYQTERHNILYGFDRSVTREDTESCLEDAELFISKVREVLRDGEL